MFTQSDDNSSKNSDNIEDWDKPADDLDISAFKSLWVEFVKWFAKSVPFESNDTKEMLSALQEMPFAKNKNMNLELSSRCICEYTQTLIKSYPANKSNKYIHAIFNYLQSDSSHPSPSRRYVAIYNFNKILSIVKDTRFSLLHHAMTEVIPVWFENVSQLIVATSHKPIYDKDLQAETKPAIELYMLSTLLLDNIDNFAIQVKEEADKMDHDDEPPKCPSIQAYNDFWEFLLKNSFSSDQHCRYQSQKVLHALASKYFTVVTQLADENLSKWIIELMQKCQWNVSGEMENSQLTVLNSQLPNDKSEQNSIITHLTAQLQGINWLVGNMKVEIKLLVTEELLFNIVQSINTLEIDKTDEDINRKAIKSQYLKQLFEILTLWSKSAEFYESFVVEIEKQTKLDLYALAIQTLLIPHSLDLDLANEEEEKSLEEIMESAKGYILVQTQLWGKRLLRGIKEVKDSHEYIDLTCLDPEIPEEYSAKVILQLTQGYLSLVEIEKSTNKDEIKNLLCDKWNQHLVGCTELWVGNDSSPVINLKGKILLNFLCQLYIPFEKVCSWLTDKSSDFQKGINWLCKFISSNTQIIEYLIARTPDHPILLSLWVPIINTLIRGSEDSSEVLKAFIRYIPREWKDPIDDDDRKADQLRTYSVLWYHCKKTNLFENNSIECSELLTHFLNQINEYSGERHPVFVKYEWLNLVGIIYNLESPVKGQSGANNGGSSKGPRTIGEVLQSSLFRIMNQYFPLWSHEIKPDTREKRYYEMIFDGILNLITFSKSPHSLKLLFRVIKEDNTLLEHKLAHALHVLITKGINKLSMVGFLSNIKLIFSEFIDFDNEPEALGNQSIHNNLKFGIVERCILKIFKTCPFEYLTALINELAPRLMRKLQVEFNTKDADTIMFQLKEKGYILKIFEVFVDRIEESSANIKDFFNSIKVQGIELTKALIKVCHFRNFWDFPSIGDKLIDNENDRKDWEQLVDFYAHNCWSLMCSVISTTQTKAEVFDSFLFTSKAENPRIWNVLVPEKTEYKFKVETEFRLKHNFYEGDGIQSKMMMLLKDSNDSFFVNVSSKFYLLGQYPHGSCTQIKCRRESQTS